MNQKGEMVSRLQTKASAIGKILQALESKYDGKLPDSSTIKTDGGGPPTKKANLRIDNFAIPPFNPNKIRKSPSSDVTAETTKEEN